MSDHTYNTDHGRFFLPAATVPGAIKDLFRYALEHERVVGTQMFSSIQDALGPFGLDAAEDNDGNIIDIFLSGSHFGSEVEEILTTVLAPFVCPGSFLVFAFGGCSGCWAVTWEIDRKDKKVTGRTVDIRTVLEGDMVKILKVLKKHDPGLWVTMQKKYS